MYRISAKNTEGYSLLEVLVAFAIMVTVLVVLLPSISNLPYKSDQLRSKVMAADYAHSRLATLGVSRKLEYGNKEGQYQERWLWREEVVPSSLSTDVAPIAEVSISILQLPTGKLLAEISVLKLLE